MIDKSTKLEIYEKIIGSEHFAHSELYQNLLYYLIEAEIENQTPGEFDIATGALNRSDDFDPTQDTIVRVHLYRLRKKLNDYYANEGKHEKFKLVIPKRSYNVNFNNNRKLRDKKKVLGLLPATLIIFLLVSLLCINIYFWLSAANSKLAPFKAVSNHPVWVDCFQQDTPALIVLGDAYTFNKYLPDEKIERKIIDPRINSLEELKAFLVWKPDPAIRITDWTHYRESSIHNLLQIVPLFYANDKQIFTKKSSSLEWQDVRHNNIIYLGHLYNLNILGNFFKMMNIRYYVNNQLQYFTIPDNEEHLGLKLSNEDGYREGHVVIAKLPSVGGNSVLLFVGAGGLAENGALSKFTAISFLNHLENLFLQTYNKDLKYFEILLKVEGYPRIEFRHEIIYMNIIDEKSVSGNQYLQE